jgi:hypothetical protein
VLYASTINRPSRGTASFKSSLADHFSMPRNMDLLKSPLVQRFPGAGNGQRRAWPFGRLGSKITATSLPMLLFFGVGVTRATAMTCVQPMNYLFHPAG